MAKLSKARAMVSDDVRRIRNRFSQALAHGYTTEEATAYANGKDTSPLVSKHPAKPPISMSGPTKARDTKPLGLHGKRPRPVEIEEVAVIDADEHVRSIGEQVAEAHNKPAAVPEQQTKKSSVKIPKDWQDLPWPKLKSLAESISGSEVKSRRQANEVIDNAT
jgi:hypothetical protein